MNKKYFDSRKGSVEATINTIRSEQKTIVKEEPKVSLQPKSYFGQKKDSLADVAAKVVSVNEDTDYLKSKLNTHQINNIKNTWKSKKASDVTPGVKAMIKKMDIPTQLAIKQANIPHLSKLIEVNELCQVGDKVKKEETMLEFTTQQIKQAYGILNDPRYKQGNYSGAVKAIEKLAKGLSKHKDVANALKRANESVIVDPKAKKETKKENNIHNKKSFEKLRNETKLVRLGDKGKTATGQKAAVIDLEPRAIPV